MIEVEEAKMDAITDDIHEIVHWIAVFETEYNLPAEVVGQLKAKLEAIVTKIQGL
jgi:hypothetical protein